MSGSNTNQLEPDINDVFDNIVLIEEKLTEQGYSNGYKDGQTTGNSEGFHLGYHRGSELGAELGYYYGIVTFYLRNKQEETSKIVTLLENLKLSLEEFPQTNDENCDIFELANGIRAQFRKCCALLKINGKYPEYPPRYLRSNNEIFESISSLINCHMVNYLTDNHWKVFVPQEIQNEIQTNEDIEQAIDLFWTDFGQVEQSKFPQFMQFVHENRKFTMDYLTDTWMSSKDIVLVLNKIGCSADVINCLQIKEFMSEKKNHEVETTAQLLSILSTFEQKDGQRLCVIDAGDGKGYLSSRLALEYKLKVLGIDANPDNSENALKRKAQLEKAWKGLTKRAEDIQNGITPPRKGRRKSNSNDHDVHRVSENYKTTTLYTTPQTDFVELFQRYFPDESPSGFCLSGLHTCGNLASSCLKIFVENKNIDGLCNVGCCYHLLGEEFCQDEFFDNRKVRAMTSDFSFPMSNYLKNLKFSLGRNARMLGAQSIHRSRNNKELPNATLFYRALLETLIVKTHPHCKNTIQVGRIKSANNFTDYVRICSKRTQIVQRLTLNLFYLLRMTFAPIIESLILLDRLLYLRENEIENSYLVKLFDPIVSPRCFGVVAVKT